MGSRIGKKQLLLTVRAGFYAINTSSTLVLKSKIYDKLKKKKNHVCCEYKIRRFFICNGNTLVKSTGF